MGSWGKGRQMKRLQADKYFSEYIRIRDDWECQRCGKKFKQGVDSQKLHCAHLWFGRANLSTRWEPLNCISLCIGCHNVTDQHPAYAWTLISKHRTLDEIMWLQQRKDKKLRIKIPEDLEKSERKRIMEMLVTIKKEKANE
tara:strand:- start:29 stop:451 length:423 start_codon:yes stop_codon:yes gene_type:complete